MSQKKDHQQNSTKAKQILIKMVINKYHKSLLTSSETLNRASFNENKYMTTHTKRNPKDVGHSFCNMYPHIRSFVEKSKYEGAGLKPVWSHSKGFTASDFWVNQNCHDCHVSS